MLRACLGILWANSGVTRHERAFVKKRVCGRIFIMVGDSPSGGEKTPPRGKKTPSSAIFFGHVENSLYFCRGFLIKTNTQFNP